MSYLDVVKSISGLTHYYPLNTTSNTKDVIGSAHGTNNGASFTDSGAVFGGDDYIELPPNQDFSATKTGGLSILVFLTISDWRGAGASEYVHWAGKGEAGKHEYTFRHYVKGGTGEASTRQGRTSFYAFNADGGLGAGSYYQDSTFPTTERVFVGTLDRSYVAMNVNGAQRDKDPLSGYNIRQTYTTAPVRLGTRDKSTGFLKGKIRRVAFYNRVLTANEIKKLYDERNQTDGATTPSPSPSPTIPTNGTVVKIGSNSHRIDGFNSTRDTDDLIVFTPLKGNVTGTNPYGCEVTVVGGKVTKVANGVGNTSIPTDGFVLSGHGTSRTWLSDNAKVDAPVIIS